MPPQLLKWTLLVAALAANCAAGARAMSLCNNTLFRYPHRFGGSSDGGSWGQAFTHVSFPAQSELKDDKSTCKFYNDRPEVCCSRDTLSDIVATFDAAKHVLDAEATVLKDEKAYADQLVFDISGALQTLCEAIPSDPYCQLVVEDIDTYSSEILSRVEKVASDSLKCSRAVLTYAKGLGCFACDVQFQSYVQLERQTLRIARRTCDNIYDACDELLQHDVNALVKTMDDFMKALLGDVHGSDLPTPSARLHDMCGGTVDSPGDCKEFLCHKVLNGLATDQWLRFDSLLDGIAAAAARSSRLLSTPAPPSSPADLGPRLGDMRTSMMAAIGTTIRAHSTRAEESAARAPVYNEYSDDGFDAWAVGCREDGADCGGIPQAMIGLLSAGCALTVIGAVAACLILRRRRMKYAAQGRDPASRRLIPGMPSPRL